jgi:hypothetical protein
MGREIYGRDVLFRNAFLANNNHAGVDGLSVDLDEVVKKFKSVANKGYRRST